MNNGIVRAIPINNLVLPHTNLILPKSVHITLHFNTRIEECGVYGIGDRFVGSINKIAKNEVAECFIVNLPNSIPCQSGHPHITIGTASGIPVDTLRMLESGEYEVEEIEPIHPWFRIDFYEFQDFQLTA